MCPQRCLISGEEGHEDIDKGGTLKDDGTKIAYDKNIHGCRYDDDCNYCGKTPVQIKPVYDNKYDPKDPKYEDNIRQNVSNLKDNFGVEEKGQVKNHDSIRIMEISIETIKRSSGLQEEADILNHVYYYIETKIKKEYDFLAFSYKMNNNQVDNNTPIKFILGKPNREHKIVLDTNKQWETLIHKKKWQDYWVDPNRPIAGPDWRDASEKSANYGLTKQAFDRIPLFWKLDKTKKATADTICKWIDDEVKKDVLEQKDKCGNKFKGNWDSKTIGIGLTPSTGMNFDEYETAFNLKENTAGESNPYTDMSNSLDIGEKDITFDDYYKRRLLSSKVENRLGGSENAYTKTFKPLNPNVESKFFNSVWLISLNI